MLASNVQFDLPPNKLATPQPLFYNSFRQPFFGLNVSTETSFLDLTIVDMPILLVVDLYASFLNTFN